MLGNRHGPYLIALAIFVNVINLLPVIQSPYLGDDAWRESCLCGIMSLTGADLFQICWETAKDYIRDGRWYPLVVYYYTVFFYLDLFYYKLGVVFFVITNILLMGYLIQLITNRKSSFLVILVLAPIFFQFRFYHDPILSYYYLMQLELLITEVSVIFFVKGLRSSRKAYMFLSVAGYFLTLLIYEAFYPVCLIFAILAYAELGLKPAIKIMKYFLPFFAVALFNLGISVAIRMHFHTSYEGTTVSLDMLSWLQAFAKQVFSAIPLSYFLLSEHLYSAWSYVREYIFYQLVFLVGIWSALSLISWDYLDREDGIWTWAETKRTGLLSIGFSILPAIIVTLAAKYQRELKWGLGYLPTYVSSFGFLLLFMILFYWLKNLLGRMNRFLRRLTVVIATLIGGILVGLNFVSNSMVVHGYNVAEHYHRSIMERSLSSGLLKDVPEGSFLVIWYPDRSWDEAAFYRMHSGLTLQVVKPPGFEMNWQLGSQSHEEAFHDYIVPSDDGALIYDFETKKAPKVIFDRYTAGFRGAQGVILDRHVKPNENSERPRAFFVKYEGTSIDCGYAVLGRLKRLRIAEGSGFHAVADHVLVYVQTPIEKTGVDILVSGDWIDLCSQKKLGEFLLNEKGLNIVSSGRHSKILEIPVKDMAKGVDTGSVVVSYGMPQK